MTLLAAGSTIAAVATLTGIYLTSRGHHWGWLYMAVLQIPFAAYDVVTGQPGFVLLGVIGGWLYLTGWKRRGHS